jgi:hypothetical protein
LSKIFKEGKVENKKSSSLKKEFKKEKKISSFDLKKGEKKKKTSNKKIFLFFAFSQLMLN